MAAERGQVVLYALVISNVSEYVVEQCKGASILGRDEAAYLVEYGEKPNRLHRDGLSTGVWTCQDDRLVSGWNPKVYWNAL